MIERRRTSLLASAAFAGGISVVEPMHSATPEELAVAWATAIHERNWERWGARVHPDEIAPAYAGLTKLVRNLGSRSDENILGFLSRTDFDTCTPLEADRGRRGRDDAGR